MTLRCPPAEPAPFCARCLLTGALTPLSEPPREAAPAPALTSPLRVGGYELIEPIARGGMGSVWRARQMSADRIVAYKTVASGLLASASERRRFQTEIEAAAQLDHPNIVPIYEVGDDEGRPFFTMRLMEGGTLAASISDSRLQIPDSEAARLLVKVTRAVHFAHERGILHRDLKPGNILLDAAGEPFVADFGLARRLELESGLTLSGDVLGTPAYLAPEVAAGGSRAATVASDLYSLGAILYELLAGQPPFQAESVPALLHKIVEHDPPPPNQVRRQRRLPSGKPPSSAATPSAGSLRREEPTPQPLDRATGTLISRDLETICLKCLAKTPAARYPSAAAFADDLERWLRGEPIQARPTTMIEFGVKWARRYPARATLLAIAAVLPALIIALLLWAYDYSRRQREQTRLNLYAADVALAATAIEQGNFGQVAQLLAGHAPRPGERDLRGFEWFWLQEQARGDAQAHFRPFTDTVMHLAVSPDGRWLAAGAIQGAHPWVWDNQEKEVSATPEFLLPAGAVKDLAFSADGQWMLAVGMTALHVYETPSFRLAARTESPRSYWACFLPTEPNTVLVGHGVPGEPLAIGGEHQRRGEVGGGALARCRRRQIPQPHPAVVVAGGHPRPALLVVVDRSRPRFAGQHTVLRRLISWRLAGNYRGHAHLRSARQRGSQLPA